MGHARTRLLLYYSEVTVRHTTRSSERVIVAVVWLLLVVVSPALAQDAAIGPSPVLPVDVAWELDLEQGLTHAPGFDDTRVYIPLRDGTLLALLLRTGQHVWARHRPVDQAPVAGDGLLVLSAGQQLIGIRAGDGRLLWTHRLDAPITAPLLWTGGWLIVALEDGALVVFRGVDGVEMWRRDLGSTVAVRPTIAGGRVYASLSDGRVTVHELSTGVLAWERQLTGTPQHILPLDAVFVGSTDNFFYRLSLTDGREEWYSRTGGDIIGAPAVDEERVYFASLDNILRALDRRSGVQQWRQPLDGRPSTGPIRFESALVVAGLSPTIQLFDTETGLPAGRFIAPDELAAPPHLVPPPDDEAPRMALLVTGDGDVMALTTASGPPRLDSRFPPHPLLPYPDRLALDDIAAWYTLAPPPPPPVAHARRFTVQVAIFDSITRAEQLAQQLRDDGYPAFVLTGRRTRVGRLHRVRIGRALGHGDAARLIGRLAADGPVDARILNVDR